MGKVDPQRDDHAIGREFRGFVLYRLWSFDDGL